MKEMNCRYLVAKIVVSSECIYTLQGGPLPVVSRVISPISRVITQVINL